LEELDGFYVAEGVCVHVTFESADRLVIDVFDSEAAASDGDAGQLRCDPLIMDVRTGQLFFETAAGRTKIADGLERAPSQARAQQVTMPAVPLLPTPSRP
jgi:hypothetical protein